MSIRINAQELSETLTPYFQDRRSATFAWANVISVYDGLLGLRGLWPMSVVGGSGEAMDVSGNGRALTNNNNAIFSREGVTYYVSAAQTPSRYFNRADESGFDVLGTESYILSSYRGLTMGCWMNIRSTPASQVMLMGKWDAPTNNRSYAIQIDTSRRPIFMISGDGSAVYQILSPRIMSTSADNWTFVVGRYGTSGTDNITIFVSENAELVKTENSTSIPAALFDSTADFTIGAATGGNLIMPNTRISLAFLCTSYLDDGLVGALFHMSKPMFLRSPGLYGY